MKLLPIVILASIVVAGCEQRRTPAKYLVPSGYEGVVITVYEQEGFPPLPAIDGFSIHKFPADGILITSSKQEFGWASDKTLDVLDGGSTRAIPYSLSGARVERFSATGTRSGAHIPTIRYAFKAIGSDAYWRNRNATEYDKKVDEAIAKIRAHQK